MGGLFALQPLPMLSDCWRNKRLGIGFVEAVCDGEKRMQVGAHLSRFVHPLAHAREHLLPRGLCLLRELFKGSAFKRSCGGENLVLDHQGAADLADEGTPIRVIRRSARMSHAWGAMPLAKFAAAVLADKGAGCDSHAAERVCAAPRLVPSRPERSFCNRRGAQFAAAQLALYASHDRHLHTAYDTVRDTSDPA